MALDIEVGLGPGYVVLDWDPAPHERHSSPCPLFSAHVYCGHGRPSQLLLRLVSRLLAGEALAGDYGSSLPCRQDGGAHRFKNAKRLLFPLSA